MAHTVSGAAAAPHGAGSPGRILDVEAIGPGHEAGTVAARRVLLQLCCLRRRRLSAIAGLLNVSHMWFGARQAYWHPHIEAKRLDLDMCDAERCSEAGLRKAIASLHIRRGQTEDSYIQS